MEHRIALSHASSLAGEAIREKFAQSGFPPDSLCLLDDASQAGSRLSYKKAYLKSQDQNQFDFSTCSLLLQPQADTALTARAEANGCLVVSHEFDGSLPVTFVDPALPTPQLAYSASRLRLAGPALSCLLPSLIALHRTSALQQVNTVLLQSVEFHGKAGVDELAAQTVNLLNSREVQAQVFSEQIAFNLLAESGDPCLANDLAHFLGNNSYSIVQQSINVPVFHGFMAALQLRFTSAIELEACIKPLQALPNLLIKDRPASPITDCNQSFSCVISELQQTPERPSCVQFWIIADPMRYGLATNYVNVSEFLLKSFL